MEKEMNSSNTTKKMNCDVAISLFPPYCGITFFELEDLRKFYIFLRSNTCFKFPSDQNPELL